MELKQYIEEYGVRNSWFSDKLGIASSTLWCWMTGRRSPPKSAVMIIENLTHGMVKQSDWAHVKEFQKKKKNDNKKVEDKHG